MEYALQDLAVRMEEEVHDRLENLPADVEHTNGELGTLIAAVDETSVHDTLPTPPQQPTKDTCNETCTPTTRFAILRNALLNPVNEWRKLPEEYRNDKSFILQFLRECNLRKLPLPSKDDFERKFPFYLRKDRGIVYAISQRYDFPTIYESHYFFVPEQYKDDKYIMLSYCQSIKRSLQECSYRLQNDLDIVTTAIQNDGMELQYASSEMQQNEFVVRQACGNNICALEFCSSKCLQNQLLCEYDFMIKIIRTVGERGKSAVENDDNDLKFTTASMQMKYARKILLNLMEPLRSNKDLLLLAMEYNILSYIEIFKNHLKYQNDFEFVIGAIFRRSSVYLELCQLPSKEHWYTSAGSTIPNAPSTTCGNVTSHVGVDNSINHDCHKVAYATITSSTSDANIIGKVLENIPTFLLSPEYNNNILVHNAIVDRADIAYVNIHLKEKFPYLCSNVEIMTRAIKRDCTLFGSSTEKDDPTLLIAAMNADTAYSLICTKSVDYVSEHIHDVLLHVIRVSKQYEMLASLIPELIWNDNITLQKAWIKRKGLLLPCTVQLLNEYSTNDTDNHMNDLIRDLSLHIAAFNSEQFFHVPLLLRSNFNFMLKALQLSSGIVMKYGCMHAIQQNIECAIHAIAYSTKDGAFKYIRNFTPQQVYNHIQMSFSHHDAFVNPILCAINQTGDSISDSFEDKNCTTVTRSPIEILNCGHETSTALLQRIALFADIKIGPTYRIYEKAQGIIRHYLNSRKPSPSSASTAHDTRGVTDHVANENVAPLRPAIGADDPARGLNLAEFQRAADRLRRMAHFRAANRLADEREDIPIFGENEQNDADMFAFDTDDEDDILEQEGLLWHNAQLDQLAADVVVADIAAAGDAGPPNQQLLQDEQPANDIDRFMLANMAEQIGHPPQINERFLDPVPLARFELDRDRAIHRRRLRVNEEEFQMLATFMERPRLPP